MTTSAKKTDARLAIQQEMLARHGNYAEVMVRTTPEATDMVNFARLWEHIMQEADRRCKAGVDGQGAELFKDSQQDYAAALVQMAGCLKKVALRHKIDLTGDAFIDRVAQRYDIAKPKDGSHKSTATVEDMEELD